MLIDCPGCAKSYHISRAALGPQGRNVVCPHCLTGWFAPPDAHSIANLGLEDDDAGSKALTAPEITAEAISERSRQPSYEELYVTKTAPQAHASTPARPRRRLPRAAAVVPATVGVAMALIAFRAPIVKLWPQANMAYAAAGLPVNARGLGLQHVRVNLMHNGAQPLLVVDGEIANLRDEKAQVPELQLAVRDAEGHEIYAWGTASPKAKLEGGETIAFRARLAAPPSEGKEVFVRFAATEPKPAR